MSAGGAASCAPGVSSMGGGVSGVPAVSSAAGGEAVNHPDSIRCAAAASSFPACPASMANCRLASSSPASAGCTPSQPDSSSPKPASATSAGFRTLFTSFHLTARCRPNAAYAQGGPPFGRTKGKTARSCFYRGTTDRRGWLGVSAAALPFPVVYKKRIALFYGKCKKTRRKKSRRALLFLRKPVIFGEAASKMPYPAVSRALQTPRGRTVYQRFTTSLYSPS